MSSLHKILFLGATGYIGGSVLQKLLDHPRSSVSHIFSLVRDPIKAEKLGRLYPSQLQVVVGDNADLGLLQALAEDADVVISVADSNDVAAMSAMLAGVKLRFEKMGRQTAFIHTSGAGIIADCTVNGKHPNSPIYDDLDKAQMATIAPTQLHRPVDLKLLEADDEGYIKSYIIVPTTVYGIPAGPLVDHGIQKRQTTVLPWLMKPSLARGQAGMVGEGQNIWHNVEVTELADLFIHLYDAIQYGTTQPAHGRDGLYFAENGQNTLLEISTVIARVMHEKGKSASLEPSPFTVAEMEENLGLPLASLIGSNARCRARRASALGWRPKKGTADLLASVEEVTRRLVEAPGSL
ncbi:NAD(P)-binding protein [Roridomyces roridus]|uniref:NAD(P)-binding protein n=1 Tax=Roridomyces roridus TaxID=1738132 RepID=A0AAD7B8I3_9AGAR|nr:NAD(P)-binding protein [Roridomyces roridus]